MNLLILFAAISIGVSFFCSILEAALLSITPSFIAKQKLSDEKLHNRLKRLKDKIDQPLAAILTLNTVAHTVGATGVGAQVTLLFGNQYLGVASAIMTVLILILSEILPKSIGAKHWRGLAPMLPGVLNTLILILKPFIWVSDQIMRLFGDSDVELDIRHEIKALSALGKELKKLDDEEYRVISNILDLHDVNVRDIMTPRTVCKALSPHMKISDAIREVKDGQFSRYPVIDKEEAPVGLLFRYDFLNTNPDDEVASLAKPATVIPDKMSAETLMGQFIHEKQHMFLVYDEYGSWLGLVTMEDVLETIIGQSIVDETDSIPNMRRYAKQRWQQRLKKAPQDSVDSSLK